MKTLPPQTANESAPETADRSTTPFDMEAAIMRAQRVANRQARAAALAESFNQLDPRARVRPVAVSIMLNISPGELARRIEAGKLPRPEYEGALSSWQVGKLRTFSKSRRAL